MNTEIIEEQQCEKVKNNKLKKANSIINYTTHEIENFKNGKVKIARKEEDVYDFIERSQKISSNAKLYFGKIGKPIAKRIKKILGINVLNYNLSLQSNVVRHIIKNHGNSLTESKRGQIAVTGEDFKFIPQIVSDFDVIKKSKITANNNQTITFQKQIDDIYYLISYISDKNHNLEVKTMWKFKANKKNSATAIDAIMPRT